MTVSPHQTQATVAAGAFFAVAAVVGIITYYLTNSHHLLVACLVCGSAAVAIGIAFYGIWRYEVSHHDSHRHEQFL